MVLLAMAHESHEEMIEMAACGGNKLPRLGEISMQKQRRVLKTDDERKETDGK